MADPSQEWTSPYLVAWQTDDRTHWSLFILPADVLYRIEVLRDSGHSRDIYVCGPWGLLRAEDAIPRLQED